MGTNYTSNKSLMLEIHKSKMSYSYDSLGSMEEVISFFTFDGAFPELSDFEEALALENRGKKDELSPIEVITIRQMTNSHIPEDAPIFKVFTKSRPQRNPQPTNFPPFRDYKLISGTIVEVRRSHWKGDLENGEFSATHGRVTDKLLSQCSIMCKRMLTKDNFRGYSYTDEMYSDAMELCFQRVLKFNESKSTNPFSYLTTLITNSFINVINTETKESKIKKDLYAQNVTPTHRKFNSNWE